MKDVYGQFLMRRSRLSKNSQKLTNLSRYTFRTCKSQQQKCSGSIEIFPPIVRQLFQLRNNDYNLRQLPQFDLPNVRSVFCGTESISFLGLKIWNIVPNEFKKETSLDAFKKLIKKWQPENCPCRLCKSYTQNRVQFCLLVYGFCYCNLFQYFIWLRKISIHYSQFCIASIIILVSSL